MMSSTFFIILLIIFSINCCFGSIRLKINGSSILDPTNNDNEIHLHGFNWMLHDVEDGDIIQYKT